MPFSFYVLGGAILSSCKPETITAESSNLLTVEPETVRLSCDGGSETISISLKKFFWDYTVSYPDGFSARPFNVEQISENELQVSVQKRRHDGSLNFDSYTGVLEIFCPDHPEIRKEVALFQDSPAPVFEIIPGDLYSEEEKTIIREGLEKGFEVPENGKTYEFRLNANFPVDIQNDCGWIEAGSVCDEENQSVKLTVEILPNTVFEGRMAGIKVGNNVDYNGEKVEIYYNLIFNQGELTPTITLDNISRFSAPKAYNNRIEHIGITSNCNWTISTDVNWIKFHTGGSDNKVSEISGNPDIEYVYADYEVNFDDSPKHGNVYIISEDNTISYTIPVTQKAFAGIRYTTTDDKKLMISENAYVGHIFENGTGKIALSNYGLNKETEIIRGAFSNCSTLKTIRLQPALEILGSSAFSGCTSLEEVVFTNSSSGKDFDLEDAVFYNCISLKEIEFPDTDDGYIGSSTFENCKSLRKVRWRGELAWIDTRAFYGCESLEELADNNGSSFLGISVGDYAFYGCKKLTSFGKLSGVGKYAFAECTALSDVQFSEDWSWQENIGDYAFYTCSSLKGITLPEQLRQIGQNAFAVSGLEKIECNHNLEKIGACAFYNCSHLTKVDLGGYIVFIGIKAFADCRKLERIRLADGYIRSSTIEREILGGAKSLISLYIRHYTPPTLTKTIFGNGDMYIGDNNPLSNPEFRIFVPEETLEDYKKAEFWKDYPLTGVPWSAFHEPF